MINFIKANYLAFSFALKGVKPTRYRKNQTATIKHGSSYFIEETNGGLSNEGFIKINRGCRVAYFPNYNRNGKTRINKFVPFKQILGAMRYQVKTAQSKRLLTIKKGQFWIVKSKDGKPAKLGLA